MSAKIEKIATLNKVFIGAIGSCGTNYLHGLLNSHPEIISIPYQYRPIDFYLKCKDSSKENLIEKILEGFSIIFNQEKTNKHGDFTNFEISQEIFKEVLDSEISMTDLTQHLILNAINCAYVKAVDQDISRVKVILIHFHDTFESRAMKLTLNDFPDAKWILPVRNPLAYMHSDVECYNNKYVTLKRFLHNNVSKIDPTIFNNIKPIGNRAIYLKLEDIHNNLRETMQNLSDFLGVSFSETMLRSTFGNMEYSSTTGNNINLIHQPNNFTDTKFKKDFSYQDIKFLETTFKQAIKKFNYEFETDANMSREELLSFPLSKRPSYFEQMRAFPRVDHFTLHHNKKKYLIVRVLAKLGLARIFLTVAFLIVKGLPPTTYKDTRSDRELAASRLKAIDENIEFNGVNWI